MTPGDLIGVCGAVALLILIWALIAHDEHKDAMK